MGIDYEQLAFWLSVLKGDRVGASDIREAFKELLDYRYEKAVASLLSFPVVAEAVAECPHLRLRLFSYQAGRAGDAVSAREVRLAAFLHLPKGPPAA